MGSESFLNRKLVCVLLLNVVDMERRDSGTEGCEFPSKLAAIEH
jgi:hypothetical protein